MQQPRRLLICMHVDTACCAANSSTSSIVQQRGHCAGLIHKHEGMNNLHTTPKSQDAGQQMVTQGQACCDCLNLARSGTSWPGRYLLNCTCGASDHQWLAMYSAYMHTNGPVIHSLGVSMTLVLLRILLLKAIMSSMPSSTVI